MDSILIIDDDVMLCKALAEELHFHGFTVTYASNPDKAIADIELHTYDVILLDLMMPGKDGFYFLRLFREKGINAKVIVLTAYSTIDTALEAAKLGASEFIAKPYEIEDLILSIKKVLQPA